MTKNRRENSRRNANNSMTTSSDRLYYAWRPNNFRRQISIKQLSNSGVKKILTTIPSASQNNHTKIISIKDYFMNITVQVFKEKILFIWKQERHLNIKKWYSIEGSSIDEIQGKVRHHKAEITQLMDSAADTFSKITGLDYIGIPKWVRYEDALKGDSFLDSLPRDAIIHAEHFKKVYADDVEFIGKSDDEPTAKMVQYINNRVVEKFTPAIAQEINNLADAVNFHNDFEAWLKHNVFCIDDCFKFKQLSGLSEAKADILHLHLSKLQMGGI